MTSLMMLNLILWLNGVYQVSPVGEATLNEWEVTIHILQHGVST